MPSPRKPSLHVHVKFPVVFVQVAFSWQLSVPHSNYDRVKTHSPCIGIYNLPVAHVGPSHPGRHPQVFKEQHIPPFKQGGEHLAR